jgi:hypothetical protein
MRTFLKAIFRRFVRFVRRLLPVRTASNPNEGIEDIWVFRRSADQRSRTL